MTARGRSPVMTDKYGPKPRRGLGRWASLNWAAQSPQQLNMPFLTAAGLLLSLLGVYFGAKSLHYHLVVQKVLTAGIADPPAGLVLDLQAHAADEMLLRQLVDGCSKREDSVLYVDSSRHLVVSKQIDPTYCPLLDMMLKGKDRGVGSCTDAAVYALYAGARIIPMPQDVGAYDSLCGPQTARLFLGPMYPQFVSQRKGVMHMQLVDPAHFLTADAQLHAKMQVFLCKTRSCLELMRQHVVDKGYWASVWLASHTSPDPRVGLSGDVITGLRASFNPGRPQAGYAIHVRGSSGLKQTRAVLDCWAQHPDWLPLVVAGAASDAELTPRSRAAGNIIYLPPIAAAGSRGAGGGAADPATAGSPAGMLDAARLRDMQGAASMHVCPALHAGFAHTLNEARAVGALIVTVDQAGLNELVTPDSGLLVPTVSTDSDPGAALEVLTHLNGHVSAQGLCEVVAKGLALSEAAQQAKRAAAQAAYRADKAAFVHRMQQLRQYLGARVQQQQRQGRQ